MRETGTEDHDIRCNSGSINQINLVAVSERLDFRAMYSYVTTVKGLPEIGNAGESKAGITPENSFGSVKRISSLGRAGDILGLPVPKRDRPQLLSIGGFGIPSMPFGNACYIPPETFGYHPTDSGFLKKHIPSS